MNALSLIDKSISLIEKCLGDDCNYGSEDSKESNEDFSRIMLWGVGRSLSTAFLRMMMEIKPKGKIFNEPFGDAFCFGPERVLHDFDSQLDTNKRYLPLRNIKFSDVINKLTSQEYIKQGYKFLFCKDFPLALMREDYPNYLQDVLKNELRYPKFCHTFLIRNPWKVGVSLNKIILRGLVGDIDKYPQEMLNTMFGFNILYHCYNECIKLGYKNCIIIDSDDLLLNPKYIMKKYCQTVGLGKYYSDNILKWDSVSETKNPGIFKHFETWKEWHEAVLDSTGLIGKTKEQLAQDTQKAQKFAKEKLPKNLLTAIEANMDAYQQLYQKRLQ